MAEFLLSAMLIASFILISSPTKCPSEGYATWTNEDRKCQQEDSRMKYHCQDDIDTDTSVPLCAIPVNCTAGTRAKLDVFSRTVSCVPCSWQMYQPMAMISYKFIQPKCDYRKISCRTDEIECEGASATQNYKCKCNYTQGMRPNNLVGCDCFDREGSICECITADCEAGTTLAADWSCVPDTPGVSTPSQPPYIHETKEAPPLWKTIVPIVVSVVIVVLAGILVFFFYRKRKKKASLSSSKDKDTGAMTSLIEKNEVTSVQTKFSEVTEDVQREPQEKKEKHKIDEKLYTGIKTLFVDSINPHSLLVRLDVGLSDEEKEVEYTERNGREAGALHLLQTVRRIHPDDWFESIVGAMKNENVGLKHIAEKMEIIRDELNGKRNIDPAECTREENECDCSARRLVMVTNDSEGENNGIEQHQEACTNNSVYQEETNDETVDGADIPDGLDNQSTQRKEVVEIDLMNGNESTEC